MRRAEPTNRTTNIAAATTTLVALVAMAAVAPRCHGLTVARIARIAQAQVAVTHLLASSHAGAAPLPVAATVVLPRTGVDHGPIADERTPLIALLDEHRLDLPPPTC